MGLGTAIILVDGTASVNKEQNANRIRIERGAVSARLIGMTQYTLDQGSSMLDE